jgi:hypothetical protein
MTDLVSPARHSRLAAVIAEARRRTRRRRTTYLIAGVLGLAIAGAGWAGFALTGGPGTSSAPVPAGFERVQARGPVTYLVLEERVPEIRTASLPRGDEAPAAVTEQFWYDQRSGLTRKRVLVDGRIRVDIAGESCVGSLGCWPAPYMDHFDHSRAESVAAGTGSFRGHNVRWFVQPGSSLRIAVDSETRKVVDMRRVERGRVLSEVAVLRRERIPAEDVSFVVPKSGAPRVFFSLLSPYSAPPSTWSNMGVTLDYGFAAARRALGTTPLWPGPRFRGLPLRSVTVGVYSFPTRKGERLHPAPYVRFDYGRSLRVEVFGKTRPWFYRQGPRPGTIVREWRSSAALTRDGQLIRVSTIGALPTAVPVALAQSLRPLPANLKTLPTLDQNVVIP